MNESTREIEVNGLQFEAFVEGPESAELVLMLHGFPQFADLWLPVMHEVVEAGFRAAAVSQRGYSSGARPPKIDDYGIENLVGDVTGFADALDARKFHILGHDWGAFIAWVYASKYPHRVLSLTALCTPHPNALLRAMQSDADQKRRSQYISLFKTPGQAAENYFAADNFAGLRRVYQGKVPEQSVNDNVRRFQEPGTLTGALNWYRALELDRQIEKVNVPTLYIWPSDDHALGKAAALESANYVDGQYRFEILEGRSHWMLHEEPETVSRMLLQHLKSTTLSCVVR
jgi:pimeloyl-ACP methyl ester carboxylesterase